MATILSQPQCVKKIDYLVTCGIIKVSSCIPCVDDYVDWQLASSVCSQGFQGIVDVTFQYPWVTNIYSTNGSDQPLCTYRTGLSSGLISQQEMKLRWPLWHTYLQKYPMIWGKFYQGSWYYDWKPLYILGFKYFCQLIRWSTQLLHQWIDNNCSGVWHQSNSSRYIDT